MIQPLVFSNVANTHKNQTFMSDAVDNSKPTMTSLNKQTDNERYSKYVKEFNEIPKKANRFFWSAQLVGTAIGALGGLFAMSKGQISGSAKQATLIGAAAGWFVSFCVGLVKKESVVEKQNKLTQNYMKFEEKYIK